MLEFIEADPLPIECRRCIETGAEDCDECDYMGLRFPLTEESQRRLSLIIEEKKRLAKLKREQIRAARQHRLK